MKKGVKTSMLNTTPPMPFGLPPSSLSRDATYKANCPILMPHTWHTYAKYILKDNDEILCGCTCKDCIEYLPWLPKLYMYNGKKYKQILLWGNVVYQAPYEPEEKDMTDVEHDKHAYFIWERMKRLPEYNAQRRGF